MDVGDISRGSINRACEPGSVSGLQHDSTELTRDGNDVTTVMGFQDLVGRFGVPRQHPPPRILCAAVTASTPRTATCTVPSSSSSFSSHLFTSAVRARRGADLSMRSPVSSANRDSTRSGRSMGSGPAPFRFRNKTGYQEFYLGRMNGWKSVIRLLWHAPAHAALVVSGTEPYVATSPTYGYRSTLPAGV